MTSRRSRRPPGSLRYDTTGWPVHLQLEDADRRRQVLPADDDGERRIDQDRAVQDEVGRAEMEGPVLRGRPLRRARCDGAHGSADSPLDPRPAAPPKGETEPDPSEVARRAEQIAMTTARNHLTLATPAVDDVTCLLPPREALLDQLAERLPPAQTQPVTLFILGLLRRDDGRPVAQSTARPGDLAARPLAARRRLAGQLRPRRVRRRAVGQRDRRQDRRRAAGPGRRRAGRPRACRPPPASRRCPRT